MGVCEHCGPFKGKDYPHDGTSWCKYCADTIGFLCSEHPEYKAVLRPRVACETCWFLWFQKQGREYFGW